MNRLAVVFLGLLTVSAALARMSDFRESWAVMESLQHLPPKFRAEWLRKRGYDNSYYTTYRKPESTGLRLVGKWGRGPSVEVTGQDSLVVLTLGSEVAIINFADPDSPEVLTEIQLDYIPRQSLIQGSLLFTGGNGIQLWDITNPAQPIPRSIIPYGVSDFAIWDTFLYFIGRDTFFIYSFANASSPYRIGCFRDSGNVATATRNTAVLIQPGDMLGFVDVTNPAAPHQVGAWSGWALSAAARGNLCCATFADAVEPERSWLLTFDISNPASPRQLGRRDSVCGMDIFMVESIAFVSGRADGYEEFQIVSITDSTRPRLMSTCYLRRDNWGVWADISRGQAFVANTCNGLAVVDIVNLSAPRLDTNVLRADLAEDVFVVDSYAYVADYRAGMRVLSVTDPTAPVEVGSVDSALSTSEAVAAQDSFAYMCWWDPPPLLRVIDITDPSHPTKAGGLDLFERPKDMVIRDTLLYIAERLRFQVVNVARPRQPVLVGSCNTQDGVSFGLAVQDSLGYLISGQLQVINVSRPSAPVVVSTTRGGASGIAVRDTFVYIPYAYDTLWVFSVADPVHPRLLSATPTSVWPRDVALGESTLYVGTSDGWGVDVFDLANPGQPVRVGRASAPYDIRRLYYSGGYLYVAMWNAGVAIYETTATGLLEAPPHVAVEPPFRVQPTLTRAALWLRLTSSVSPTGAVRVCDVAGRTIMTVPLKGTASLVSLSLAKYPSGVYWFEGTLEGRHYAVKVVKQ